MNSLIVPLRCPNCASKVKPVTIGEATDRGTNINAVFRCTRRFCRTEFSLHIFLMAMGVYTDDGEPHGTSKACERHRALKEKLCDECRAYATRATSDSRKTEVNA